MDPIINSPNPTDPTDQDARLEAMLAEDLGQEGATFLSTVKTLRTWDAPAITPEHTAKLLAAMSPHIPNATPDSPPARLQTALRWPPILILRVQLNIVQLELWWACTLIMAIGVLVTLLTANLTLSGLDLPFVLVSPAVAAIGLAFLYDSDNEGIHELENATPVSPVLLLLARFTLVFGFNLLLGLIGSVALALTHPQVSLLPLISAWLAPMSLLSTMAFLFAILTHNPSQSIAVSFGTWVMLIMIRYWNHSPLNIHAVYLPDLLDWQLRPVLFGVALLTLGIALYIAEMGAPFRPTQGNSS
jgi:hypothetical protein